MNNSAFLLTYNTPYNLSGLPSVCDKQNFWGENYPFYIVNFLKTISHGSNKNYSGKTIQMRFKKVHFVKQYRINPCFVPLKFWLVKNNIYLWPTKFF